MNGLIAHRDTNRNRMIFDITHDDLADVFGAGNIRCVPYEAAGASGITGETLRFLTEVGLPDNDFVSFAGLDDSRNSLRKVSVEELGDTWDLPSAASDWLFAGNFEISAIVLDAASGELHQMAEGVMRPVPLHGDVSSLVHTVTRLTQVVRGLPEGYEDDDEALEELEGVLDGLKREITARDPRPFGDEHSEWLEIVMSIGAGLWGPG
ncbi:SUKH-4 family immunity protein [Streptomyces sp. NPDC052701]|uniref:SUKH-4 family immunity protein n=1 Tax=Streptomyces sp. NPDC052701 TaxID=3155533 RepID=UPI0034433D91